MQPTTTSNSSYVLGVRLLYLITGIAATFVTVPFVANLILQEGVHEIIGYRQLFDIDAEANLPTWFAASIFYLAALFAWMISTKDERDRLHWRTIFAVLILIGTDEILSFHNTPSRRLREVIGIHDGFLMNAWVLIGAALVLLVGIIMFRFALRQPRWLAIGLVIAALLYITGALVLEVVGSKVEFDFAGLEYEEGGFYLLSFELIAIGEEFFEYLGILLTNWLLFFRARELRASMTLSVD